MRSHATLSRLFPLLLTACAGSAPGADGAVPDADDTAGDTDDTDDTDDTGGETDDTGGETDEPHPCPATFPMDEVGLTLTYGSEAGSAFTTTWTVEPTGLTELDGEDAWMVEWWNAGESEELDASFTSTDTWWYRCDEAGIRPLRREQSKSTTHEGIVETESKVDVYESDGVMFPMELGEGVGWTWSYEITTTTDGDGTERTLEGSVEFEVAGPETVEAAGSEHEAWRVFDVALGAEHGKLYSEGLGMVLGGGFELVGVERE